MVEYQTWYSNPRTYAGSRLSEVARRCANEKRMPKRASKLQGAGISNVNDEALKKPQNPNKPLMKVTAIAKTFRMSLKTFPAPAVTPRRLNTLSMRKSRHVDIGMFTRAKIRMRSSARPEGGWKRG